MCHLSFSFKWLLSLLAVTVMLALQAQTAEVVLTKVQAIQALPAEVAAKGEEFHLHDGEACISVIVTGEVVASAMGAKVATHLWKSISVGQAVVSLAALYAKL